MITQLFISNFYFLSGVLCPTKVVVNSNGTSGFSAYYGENVTVQCDESYVLGKDQTKNSLTLTCQADGSWDADISCTSEFILIWG